MRQARILPCGLFPRSPCGCRMVCRPWPDKLAKNGLPPATSENEDALPGKRGKRGRLDTATGGTVPSFKIQGPDVASRMEPVGLGATGFLLPTPPGSSPGHRAK